jgi:hypothetical protein
VPLQLCGYTLKPPGENVQTIARRKAIAVFRITSGVAEHHHGGDILRRISSPAKQRFRLRLFSPFHALIAGFFDPFLPPVSQYE